MHSFLAFFLALLHAMNAVEDPETYMSAFEMIKRWDYPAEHHDVITADGYILTMFRIPHGRSPESNSSCFRPAILLVHGFTGSSTEWILNPPETSPGFLLADAGFDVFLANHRGTTYSKRHITLAPWINQFSQYSIDELSKYDATAMVDKIIQVTGQKSIYYMGHSQGTATGFMMLADHPEYNKKVKALFQIGPIGTGSYMKGPASLLPFVYNNLHPIADVYRLFGSHQAAWQWSFVYRPLIRLIAAIPYGPAAIQFVSNVVFENVDTSSQHVTIAYIYLAHTQWCFHVASSALGAGNSIMRARCILIYVLKNSNILSKNQLTHMDHNPLENIQRYGQETPTLYNYSRVDSPVYLFWSRDDWLTTTEEVENLRTKLLRPEVVKGGAEIPGYGHIDFVHASDIAEKVFDPITRIAAYEKNIATEFRVYPLESYEVQTQDRADLKQLACYVMLQQLGELSIA